MRSPGDCLLRACAAVFWSPRSCGDEELGPDSRRRSEGEFGAAVSGCDSLSEALLEEKWRDSRLLSLVVLLGKEKPGNPSPPVVSILGLGVDVGSTDTADLIGKIRSVTVGLMAPNGDSEEDGGIGALVTGPTFSCGLDLHCPRFISEPPNLGSWESESEKER